MEILIRYLKTFPLEMGGGGSDGKEYVYNGVCSKRTCAYDGGSGSNFLPFWCVRTNFKIPMGKSIYYKHDN